MQKIQQAQRNKKEIKSTNTLPHKTKWSHFDAPYPVFSVCVCAFQMLMDHS